MNPSLSKPGGLLCYMKCNTESKQLLSFLLGIQRKMVKWVLPFYFLKCFSVKATQGADNSIENRKKKRKMALEERGGSELSYDVAARPRVFPSPGQQGNGGLFGGTSGGLFGRPRRLSLLHEIVEVGIVQFSVNLGFSLKSFKRENVGMDKYGGGINKDKE